MAAKMKKNKAKKLSENELTKKSRYRPWQEFPQQVQQLLKSYYKRKRRGGMQVVDHPFYIIGITKTWIPATSRCHRAGQRTWPQLCSLEAPAQDQYLTDTCQLKKHEEVAMVGYRVMNSNGYVERGRAIYKCVVADPFDAKNKYMEFTSVVYLENKMYALSLQGSLAVIDSRSVITRLSSNRAVPSVSARFFKEHLVAMDGGVFLVFFIHGKSVEVVDQVEVFRLCLDKVRWVKVERLEGKTMFFDVHFVNWVESAKIGCREDCVYFTWGEGSDNRWWIYDMKTDCFSHV